MIYLSIFTFPDNEMEFDFFIEVKKTCYDVFYPFRVLSRHGFERIDFEPVTILYGGNGSGKSTALNVIAEKIGINRDSIYNKSNFYPNYINMCGNTPMGKVHSCTLPKKFLKMDFIYWTSLKTVCLPNGRWN